MNIINYIKNIGPIYHGRYEVFKKFKITQEKVGPAKVEIIVFECENCFYNSKGMIEKKSINSTVDNMV